jgi:hypothetical protein
MLQKNYIIGLILGHDKRIDRFSKIRGNEKKDCFVFLPQVFSEMTKQWILRSQG